MKILNIQKPIGCWFPGDIAGFPDDRADALIASGAAVEVVDPSKAEPEPELDLDPPSNSAEAPSDPPLEGEAGSEPPVRRRRRSRGFGRSVGDQA